MTTPIAAKLPDDLVRRVDSLVEQGEFANRSAAVRRGLEVLVEQATRGKIARSFADGYQRFPETDAEMSEARRLAEQSIADEPWEPWW